MAIKWMKYAYALSLSLCVAAGTALADEYESLFGGSMGEWAVIDNVAPSKPLFNIGGFKFGVQHA